MSPALARAPIALLGLLALIACPDPARADFLYGRLTPQGGEANARSSWVDVSSDGRTVVFTSDSQLWLGDTFNGTRALAVDLQAGTVEALSADGSGLFRGEAPAVSGDGRYIAFLTHANGSYGPNWQALRKDRQTGAVVLASSNLIGQAADSGIEDNTVSISADGRHVAFQSTSSNLGAAHANPAGGGMVPAGSSGEIFVKDMVSGELKVASRKNDGSLSGGTCDLLPHALSGNGRLVVMLCSPAMVGGATAGQVYVRDLQANTTELISRSAAVPNGASTFGGRPAISPNGRFVSFQMRGYGGLGYADGANIASNSGIYVRDRQAGTTTSIPRPALLPSTEYDTCSVTAISDVGSVVLACLNTWAGAGRYPQVFLFVPGAGAPELISPAAGGTGASNGSAGSTLAVNASGLSMAWESEASNADANDHNGVTDIYVLVEESVIFDVIFANGFDPAEQGRVTAPAVLEVMSARGH